MKTVIREVGEQLQLFPLKYKITFCPTCAREVVNSFCNFCYNPMRVNINWNRIEDCKVQKGRGRIRVKNEFNIISLKGLGK